ncbi:putative PLAC8 motif-containing protein [Plasmopara halstedii]
MQFEPPIKPADMTVNITDGENSNQGIDSNGIVTGRWKTGIFGFTDSIVPNGIMSCCCPGLVVAQISARLGMTPFYHVLGIVGGLYLLALIAITSHSGFLEFLFWLCFVISALCMMRLRWRIRSLFSIPGTYVEDAAYTFFCGCCSVAQMASHVESYEPGTFAFTPRATLQGYSNN